MFNLETVVRNICFCDDSLLLSFSPLFSLGFRRFWAPRQTWKVGQNHRELVSPRSTPFEADFLVVKLRYFGSRISSRSKGGRHIEIRFVLILEEIVFCYYSRYPPCFVFIFPVFDRLQRRDSETTRIPVGICSNRLRFRSALKRNQFFSIWVR